MAASLLRLVPVLALCGLTGCLTSASASRTFQAASPAPVDMAPEKLALEKGRILVLTPRALQPPAPPTDANQGTDPATPDWERAASAAERALLKGSWKPLTATATGDDGTGARPGTGLVERAVAAARGTPADHILLLRELRSGFGGEVVPAFRPNSLCPWRGMVPLEVTTDATLLDRDGQVLWTGRGVVDATHLMPPGTHQVDYLFDAGTRSCNFAFAQPLRDHHLADRTCVSSDLRDATEPTRVICERVYRAPADPALVEASAAHLVEGLNRAVSP